MGAYLNPAALLPIAQEAVEQEEKKVMPAAEMQAAQRSIDALTAQLDRVYLDRLSGLLPEEDFARIFQRIRMERSLLEERLKELEQKSEKPVSAEARASELVCRFLEKAFTNREVLVSLIERVELTEDKRVIIRFRCKRPDEAE